MNMIRYIALLLAFFPALAWGQVRSSGPVPNIFLQGALPAGDLLVGIGGNQVADGGVPSGIGNVTGPASSTSGHLATFSGATGKIIQDQGTIAGAYNWSALQTFGPISTTAINGVAPLYVVRDDSAASANVTAGGTGYSDIGDLATVIGGTCTTQPILALNASGGVVSSFSVSTRGKCSTPPTNPVSVTGGAGNGATFNLSWAAVSTVNTFAPPGVTGGPNGVQVLGVRAGENNQGGMTGLTAYGIGTAGSGLHNADGMGGGTGMTATASENTFTGYYDGTQITTGSFLNFNGHEAGSHEYNGIKENFSGTDSGKWTINGQNLVFDGADSGKFLLNPSAVVAIGVEAARGAQIFATVSGAANNGSGLCRLTVNSTTGMATGDEAVITNVAGATGCNGVFSTVTIVDSTHIDLTGSTFGGAYTSGGNVAAYTSHALTNATLVGYNVLTSAAMRSAGSLVGVGDSVFQSLTTGVRDVGVGHNTFGFLTTGIQDTGIGDNAGNTCVTSAGIVLVGYGADCTASNTTNAVAIGGWNGGSQATLAAHASGGSTVVGAGAGSVNMTGLGNSLFGIQTGNAITSGTQDLIAGTSTAPCNPPSATTSNWIGFCAGSGSPSFSVSGANTPSTSITTIAGNLVVTGTPNLGIFTGTTCTNAGFLTINDAAGNARKVMICT